MHFCTAMIKIGDDNDNVLAAGMFAPISWPEIQVIQFLHGESSVDEVRPFVQVDMTPREERQRLVDKYGEDKVAEVFPRSGPQEMEAPEATLAYGELWRDPRTLQITMVEGGAFDDGTGNPHTLDEFGPLGADDPMRGPAATPPKRVGGRFVSQKGADA